MNNTDQIISALYLAKSDSRKKMLSDLILSVLYSIDQQITQDEILTFIKETYFLEPIIYEIEECLEFLVENKKITIEENNYRLEEVSKIRIYNSIIKGQNESSKREQTFRQIVKDAFNENLDDREISDLWNIFNDYLIECFLVFGRKAINIFLPFNNELGSDGTLLDNAYQKLRSEKLVLIFKRLLFLYPERLTDAELRYLTLLASRAEKFYSLGILKEDYEKIKNLQIKDLTVIVDTNVLYSVLKINLDPEKSAIAELIRVSKEKQIDLKIAYLPKTFAELQKARAYLERLIPRENFQYSQIKALLNSEKLVSVARKYYENKLENSEFPHPSEIIKYAGDLLKEKGINVYNSQFLQLVSEKTNLKSKIKEYEKFQKNYFRWCFERGVIYSHKKTKQIDHDVFLREAVKNLKSKAEEKNELKFICLTLDKTLIYFDKYSFRKELSGSNEVVYPNFILPSLFIKKIRPFIPIATNDYRKAFLTSLTAPTFEEENDKETILVQKSLAYFRNLGIEDEEIILNCIKRELFLEDFAKHEDNESSEEFIRSEIANEISRLKVEKEKLENNIRQKEKEKETILDEKRKLFSEKETIETELKFDISARERQIISLENRLRSVEKKVKEEKVKRENDKRHAYFEKRLTNWKLKRENYVNESWNNEIAILRKKALYFVLITFLTILPILITILLNTITTFKMAIQSLGNHQWWIWGTLIIVFLVELIGRAYIFDKEKVKEGWYWFYAFLSTERYKEIMKTKKEIYKNEFMKKNPEPQENKSA